MRRVLYIFAAVVLPGGDIRTSAATDFPLSATVPRTVEELWSGYPQFDMATPLELEILKTWEEDGIACRVIRYQVGIFKGKPTRVAAFYTHPRNASKLPALLQMHGGGQSANLDDAIRDARRGYASLSLNWGGNKLDFGRSKETYDGPQTNWGTLDATHPPQRNKTNHFAGPLTPDDYTLDTVESPRNSNWFLVLIAARRAITLLEQQPEVDPSRIGAYGHSMGGKLTTDLAGIDQRIKAVVPSCGGSGDILESQTDLPGCSRTRPTAMELHCLSDNAYIPRIQCPVLWLSPTNDFHAHIDNMAWNWRNLPDHRLRFSIAPHLNHRHTNEHEITRRLWFDENLKGIFKMPRTPPLTVTLRTADGVPAITVTPDASMPVRRVDVYYSIDPHELTRFWRSAVAVKAGGQWHAICPVMSLDHPLFAYANIIYETPAPYQQESGTFALSSRVWSALPSQLLAAGVKATDKPARMIDEGARGWRDWYRLNWDHPPLWVASTRKLKDPKWRGPDGAKLVFEIRSLTDNSLVVNFNCNAWGAIRPGKPTVNYAVARELKGSPEWQTVSVRGEDLAATDPTITAPLTNWQSVTEFSISPSGQIVRNGLQVKVDGKPWQGLREIRNLRWEDGEKPSEEENSAGISP